MTRDEDETYTAVIEVREQWRLLEAVIAAKMLLGRLVAGDDED